MTVGSKEKYTEKQKRKAEHIENSYEKKGMSHERAEQIAWATVNKQSGGGELSGSGTTTSEQDKEAARKNSAQNAAKTREQQAQPYALEHQPLARLRAQARKRHIHGRSTMNKVELIHALRRT